MKRLFDLVMSVAALILLSPLFLLLTIWISLDSKGGVFYRQSRVGKNNRDFKLFKFRTMKPDSFSGGGLTLGDKDPRITRSGSFLRKYKLDELPQLLNIIKGEMSFVGPRPEVREFVRLYNEQQRKVLAVKPGLTDFASLEYINEGEILSESEDPRQTYINEIMPAKLELNLKYIREKSFLVDLKIIARTIAGILR